jgi:uncharacterized iron-regulated membrane protein
VRTVHRLTALFAGLIMLYMGVTGSLIQSIDLRTLHRHTPASDPNMQAIHESIYGPPNYLVITDSDYEAPPLPAGLDLATSLDKVLHASREIVGVAPLSFIELRMKAGRPVGQVKSGDRLLAFDVMTGAPADPVPIVNAATLRATPSQHNSIKNLHRLTTYGQWTICITLLFALALCVFLVTGLWLYFRLLAARARIGRRRLFWFSGGWWRTLHRVIAVAASVLVLVVALSGTWLAMDSIALEIYLFVHHGNRSGVRVDESSALPDSQLQAMLRTTVESHAADRPEAPIKVLRLRYFAGMPQGVIVDGGKDTQQYVYNSLDGRKVSETEPGYPSTGFPFGFQIHQIAKQIHRGDYFGLTGRWLDLLAGLSIVFLAISGAVMYFNLWSQRRRGGRKSLLWT